MSQEKEFNLSKMGIDGKELGILFHESSVSEFLRRERKLFDLMFEGKISMIYFQFLLDKLAGEKLLGNHSQEVIRDEM